MTNMPALDKNSGMQNILSAKGTKPASSSSGGSFDTVLKQTTQAGRQDSQQDRKTDQVKNSGNQSKAENTASKDQVNKNSKAEENAETKETDTQVKAEETEDITEDTDVLERAGGEMAAALAAQMGISEETLRDAMDALGMTDVSLLDPKNVKSLMVELTDGADDMSLLMDEDFYNSVTEALNTLEDIAGEVQMETGMSQEEFNAAVLAAEKRLSMGDVSERTETVQQESGKTDVDVLKLNTQGMEQAEEAGTETAVLKEEPKQESAGKDNESPFMQNSYQTQNLQQAANAAAAETESTFSMADTQEIMDQIMDYMKVSVKPDMTSLEMQLHPESLGTLHIQISNKEGAVTAQFIAQNESVRAALESQVMELKENLEQQGIKVEAVEVTIAQYSLDRNPDGNNASSEQGRQSSRRSRNLNLGDLSLEEEEELTEEEQLAAEVMRSEGSTINYTA